MLDRDINAAINILEIGLKRYFASLLEQNILKNKIGKVIPEFKTLQEIEPLLTSENLLVSLVNE